MKRANFYSSEIANSPDIVGRGFKALVQAAKSSGSKTAWLICHTKGNLDGIISQVIGADAVAALSNGKTIRLTESCSLVFFHSRSLPPFADGSPVLVCHPEEALLQRVDGLTKAACFIVLPWSMDDIGPWIMARCAVDILGKVNASPSVLANQVVRAALEELFATINVSTGVIHPSDKDAAIGTFRVLRDAGEACDLGQVSAWVVQKGMDPKHAAAVEAIASNPGSSRFSRGAFKTGPADLCRWRSKAVG